MRAWQFEQSIMAELQAPTGNLRAKLAAWQAFRQNDEDFDKVVDALLAGEEAAAQAALALPQGGGPQGAGPGASPGAPTRPGVAGAAAPRVPPFAALERFARRRR